MLHIQIISKNKPKYQLFYWLRKWFFTFLFFVLTAVFSSILKAYKDWERFSGPPNPVFVNLCKSLACCSCSVTAALLTGVLSDKLKEWFCCPAVLVYSSICHTALRQLSQDGLTLVNYLVPYVGFHWLRLFFKTDKRTHLNSDECSEAERLLFTTRVQIFSAHIWCLVLNPKRFIQEIKSLCHIADFIPAYSGICFIANYLLMTPPTGFQLLQIFIQQFQDLIF